MLRTPPWIPMLAWAALACRPAAAQEMLPPPAVPQPAPFVQQPNPFAPLPEGAIIGPAGPVMPGPPPAPRNAVVLPPLDAELVWTKMVDVADDFFKVHSEQRVVFANGVPTEGRIETFPQTGATVLEPWRGDSVGWNERWESTLQSIRRIATMRLTPDAAGWRVEVEVDKELEYLPRPMRATTGGASFRNDDSLYRYGTPLPTLGQQVGDQPRPVASPTPNLGWIPLGRDPKLEQKMLSRLLAKLGVPPQATPEPYYQPPDAPGAAPLQPAAPPPPAPQAPIYGAPITPEQLPPGAQVAPGPPVPIETLPIPR
ncbi:MAG: hypothetical protein ACKO40_02110 [Planctomycetaceae bacterium]